MNQRNPAWSDNESIPWIQGRPSLAEPKQVNRGGFAVAVIAGVHLTWLQSSLFRRHWHELQLPLPLNRLKPAISSAVIRVVALQERVEFRREVADLHGLLVCVNRRTPVVIDRVCLCAFFRSQPRSVQGLRRTPQPSWSCADLLSVVWELDVEESLPHISSRREDSIQPAEAETPRKQCQEAIS